jgi:hypothetical protein
MGSRAVIISLVALFLLLSGCGGSATPAVTLSPALTPTEQPTPAVDRSDPFVGTWEFGSSTYIVVKYYGDYWFQKVDPLQNTAIIMKRRGNHLVGEWKIIDAPDKYVLWLPKSRKWPNVMGYRIIWHKGTPRVFTSSMTRVSWRADMPSPYATPVQ